MAGISYGKTERKEQDMAKEKVTVDMFNWGPCVVRMTISEEFRKLLLDEARKNKDDYTGKLAGQIEKETGYSEESKAKILPFIANCLGVYDQAWRSFTKKKRDKENEYVMSALWINYQKQNEFNPPHDHDGALSFVIYLQIPEELKEENKNYKGLSAGPGGLTFIYGETEDRCITNHSVFPEEGDMYVFPAWLKHWVYPYQSDCTRVSVSGNVIDRIELSKLKKVDEK